MKIHGNKGWETYPSYFDIFIPHVLNLLKELNINITFFVVGQDAAIEENRDLLKEISRNGHEIGNHSFNHESWLHLYKREQIEVEISKAEDVIYQTTGQITRGFRGPGFSWNPELLVILKQRDYLFDASTLPTYIGPLARMYYFMTANLSEEEKKDRSELFGSFRDGFRPVKSYFWELNSNEKFLEIPVTTIPGFKTPFHLSYLLYLSRFSMVLMKFYLNFAIMFCKISNTQPSFLLHPLDLIGGDQITELAFFPGMDIKSEKKVEVFNLVIKTLIKHYELVNMNTHAKHLIENVNLRSRKLNTN